MKTVITVIIALLINSVAQARLGETPEQCKLRYGDVVKWQVVNGSGPAEFRKGLFSIRVLFADGKAVQQQFKKVQYVEGVEVSDTFTENEVAQIMAAQNGGAEWYTYAKLPPLDEFHYRYWTDGYRVLAGVDVLLMQINFFSKERAEQLAVQQSEILGGF